MPKHNQPMYDKNVKINFSSIKKIVLYIKKYLVGIIFSLVFAIVSSICSFVGPLKLSELMDLMTEGVKLSSGVDLNVFLDISIFLICIYLVGAVLHYLQQFLMADVTQNISKNLRSDIDKKINKLPLKYFDTTTTGDIISRITNDVDTISQTLGSSITELFNALVLFIGVLVMMFIVNWILALVTILSSMVGFLLSSSVLKKSQTYFHQRQGKIGELTGYVEEIYSNQKIVKSFNAQEKTINDFAVINNDLYNANKKAQFLSGMMGPFMGFAGNFSYLCIFVFGVVLSINNLGVSFGTIISFTIFARLFSRPLSTLAQTMAQLQQTSAAATRIFEILDQEELSDESNKTFKLNNVKGNVEFDHVNFAYNEKRTIIKDFSVNLKSGMKVAIVGPTGAGKTTIVNLLMRFYETNNGDIKIDGHSIKDMKRSEVRNLFDMILQDTWLMNGTIRDNLVFNKKNVNEKELDKVTEAVGLDYFIKTLPDGYDTVINEASTLSEGQKQQLTIARAMIKNSPLLILDEATSSIDTRTEIKIQEAMDKLTKGRTSFIIAHRLSTIKNADIILVMRDGDIVEQGNHKELLKQNGFYASLYNSQFDNVE